MLLQALGGGTGAVGSETAFGFEVPLGDPGALEAAASAARRLAQSLRDQAGAVRAAAGVALAGWSGPAAGSFSGYCGRLLAALDGNTGACDHAAQALGQLARALSEAQTATRQAMGDCVRYQGEMQTQQGAAQTAGQEAQDALDQASSAVHPSVVQAFTRQADAALGRQRAAAIAAGNAEEQLLAAERRGRHAWESYLQSARGLAGRIEGAAGEIQTLPCLAGAPVPVPVTAADSAQAERIAALWAAGRLRGDPVDAIPPSQRTPGAVLALAQRIQALQAARAGSSSGAGGHSVSLNPALGVPLLLSGLGMSGVGGARAGVSGVASLAGRTLRTGATAAERSAAARVLPEAGGLAKDLEPFARGAAAVGVVVNVASDVANHESAGQTIANTAGSVGGATIAGGVVGGVCEGGTLGLGTPGCVVLGGLAAGAGGAAGGWVADHVYKPVSSLISSLIP